MGPTILAPQECLNMPQYLIMDVRFNQKKVNDTKQSGQAILEFITFLPLILIIYVLILTIGNSINGSINQQKITRSYFYNIILNDSFLPNKNLLREINADGVKNIGMYAVGWCERRVQRAPEAPCYQMLKIKDKGDNEKCNPGERTRPYTQFIRVKTVYGVCATTYYMENGIYHQANNVIGLSVPSGGSSSCLNLM